VAQQSTIEWTDVTWNPVAGCSIASAGCTNCYAMRMAARLDAMGVEKYADLTRKTGGKMKWTGNVREYAPALSQPYSWKKGRKIFVNSMSDLFHEDVSDKFIRQVWQVMEDTQQHSYQILTKRPDRMAALLQTKGWPVLSNVWLGTSVESGEVLDRIDHLRQVPAAIRFISFEPLIGSVAGADLSDIHWAIVGGESGPGARFMDASWVNEIEDMCEAFGVAFFFKQWGGVNKKKAGREWNGRIVSAYPEERVSL
jgi:protein gp37